MSNLHFSKKDNYARCKNSAIYSLAMREHSRQELFRKLEKKKTAEGVDLNQLLDELEENDYLNEDRFTESFIRYRITKGQGPIKISNELRQRGIQNNHIYRHMNQAEVNWFDMANEQLTKKYGFKKAEDYKEKTKRMRFLSSRGFSHEVINTVVE